MSAKVPSIKVETENSSRPMVEIKNPVNISGVDIDDNDSDTSGETVEATSHVKKTKIGYLFTKLLILDGM